MNAAPDGLPTHIHTWNSNKYELEYTTEVKHREAYFDQRDAVLETLSISNDSLQHFLKVPGDSYVLRGG